MTIDHPLRRVLARVCSADTMSRVVDPVFADMRWEDGRATLRGCATLAKALALDTIMSTPAWAPAVWFDDGHALPRIAGLVLVTAGVTAVPLIVLDLWDVRTFKLLSPAALVVNLLPGALGMTLPSALAVAIPLSLRQRRVSGRLIRRTLLLASTVVAVNFIVLEYAMPDANQSFRQAVARAVSGSADTVIRRGPNEIDLTTLGRQIADLRRTGSEPSEVRQLEYAYQVRLAIISAAVPLGLAGVAISVAAFGRRRPLLTAGVVLGVWWTLMWVGPHVVNTQPPSRGFQPEYVCAWTPNLLVLIASFAILGVRYAGNRPSTLAIP